DHVVGVRPALLRKRDQIVIVKLSFSVRTMRLRKGRADCKGVFSSGPWSPRWKSGALTSPGSALSIVLSTQAEVQRYFYRILRTLWSLVNSACEIARFRTPAPPRRWTR